MNEAVLRDLLQLFAIIANVNKEGVSEKARFIVKSYLRQHLNQKFVIRYLGIFEEYLPIYHRAEDPNELIVRKRSSERAVKVLKICHQINERLPHKDKIIITIRLLEYVNEDEIVTPKELDFVNTVSEVFKIKTDEFEDMKALILYSDLKIINPEKLLVIDGKDKAADLEFEEIGQWFEINKPDTIKRSKFIYNENLKGRIAVLDISSVNLFIFRYFGHDSLNLNSHNIIPGRTYIFTNGAIIKSQKINTIYYNEIASRFILEKTRAKIVLEAKDIQYKFKKSDNGIHPFRFTLESGNLVGIMGGSGVGKSTLLNLLNGNLPLRKGKILINGYDLHRDADTLKGVIGFVPQDDLLIEELTVYQNIYFNARLCFSNYNNEHIAKAVNNVLEELDLFDIRDLKVGNPLNKFISGGQRKRLNIALELIREPSILIVDEPTSGLSSMDSETVMALLKEQTIKGKLVIVNIHQPSSDIFKMFDNLIVLDKGGYPIYFGNPIDAIEYFKTISGHVNITERECNTCGNVNPDQILEIIEAKELNEYGKFTRNRKVSPKEWYEFYKERIELKNGTESELTKPIELPRNSFKIPAKIEQFKIFVARNILAKIADKQYLYVSLFESPLLALILSFFIKYYRGTETNFETYIFSENINIPAYLFMSVIVALFLGLTVSAEEIIKDQRILKREKFLHLSRSSYLNAKVLYLFGLSALQTALYVLVGNNILEISGMGLSYWLVLFSTSCFANLAGLNISAGMKSVVTIYILIPFILVPQLLLSGVIVDFNKLNKYLKNPDFVPIAGDLITGRWAFEALAVEQFKNNEYDKLFYSYNKSINQATFKYSYLIANLQSRLDKCERNLKIGKGKDEIEKHLNVLKNEISKLIIESPKIPYWYTDSLTINNLSKNVIFQTAKYLDRLSLYYVELQQQANNELDSKYNHLLHKIGKEGVIELKKKNHNNKLTEMVERSMDFEKITESHGRLIQLYNPIYYDPESNFGRAHFFAPVKKIAGMVIDTFWFNIIIIWISVISLYITLYFDILKKSINFFEHFRIFKSKKRH